MKIEWSTPIVFGGKGGYVWPDYDGVYVIAEKIDQKLVAKYVGQGQIDSRMEDHKDWKNEPNECLKKVMKDRDSNTTVYHAEINNDDNRDNAEYTIWYNYGGSIGLLCNEISPPGKFDSTVEFPFDKIALNY